MNYKVKKTLKDNRKSMIIIAVLWVIFAIVLVAPLSYSIALASQNGAFNFEVFFRKYLYRTCKFYIYYKGNRF